MSAFRPRRVLLLLHDGLTPDLFDQSQSCQVLQIRQKINILRD
jgi:hypothetical protein